MTEREKGRPYLRLLRYLLQWTVVAVVVYGGLALYTFYGYLEEGRSPLLEKPLSVEGFLPIGALMALKLWVTEGLFDPVHPAALVIFVLALTLSVLLKKSFCGWICPVGAVSELTWKSGRLVFGRNISLPRYLDYPLRSVKYLLMAFFLYVIVLKMSSGTIRAFLQTPYWKVADLKLLLFFTEPTRTTLLVLLGLFVLSLFIKNFWCRYLCPYGALLGLLSLLSPFKVTRWESRCIHCRRCTESCPSLLPVEQSRRLSSPECMGCLTCVSNCPVQGALDIGLTGGRRLNPFLFAALVVAVFWGGVLLAKATGHWNSNVTYEEYLSIIPGLRELEHP